MFMEDIFMRQILKGLHCACLLFAVAWCGTANATIPLSERVVLVNIYSSTNGAGWISSAGWNGTLGTECSWYGITCDAAQGHVTAIKLNANKLVGTLPSLGGLTFLQDFEVYSNQLTGSIPTLSGLTALQQFVVSGNRLSGAIPSLGGLTALQSFWADSNLLSGSIPALSGLTALQKFYVFSNQLTGSIPSLTGLTALSNLALEGNQLTGAIPPLDGLTSLWYFDVGANKLTGTVPSLSGLTALQYFVVNNNQLSGPIPAAPATLGAGQSNLCGNALISSGSTTTDNAWNAATGVNWKACQIAAQVFTLTVTDSGTGFGSVASVPDGISCYMPRPGVAYFVASDCTENYSGGTSVTLTATPDADSYFAGWSGDCIGAGVCVVAMSAAKSVTASFRPLSFVVKPTVTRTETTITVTTRITFNPADVGKQGAVYVTGWVPVTALTALGLSSVDLSQIVTRTTDDPRQVDAANLHLSQGSLADTDVNSYILIQKTANGWQLVVNDQLKPYSSGVLDELRAAQTILDKIDFSKLTGAQFCLGYSVGTAEPTTSGKWLPVITGLALSSDSTGSCNVASPPASPYTGLFWNPAESGWGMSITQQASMIFAAWYVYDASGKPTWYVMPSCPVSGKSCAGAIYSVVGGTPLGVPWNGASKTVAQAGTGTLSFSDNDNASFSYTLNSLSGTRVITRQLFGAGATQPLIDYSALWWNADESGWGTALTRQYGTMFAAIYTYDASGKPIWYVASNCPMVVNSCTGALYQVGGGVAPTASWSNPKLTVTQVGTVSFLFTDSSIGTMNITVNGVTTSKAITRQPL
jgi:hypothetical protein